MSVERVDRAEGLAHIVNALEAQLTSLDQLGAHIAAAHVDAAINQLRLDRAMSDKA